jgi:exodeoxyribonuclease-3
VKIATWNVNSIRARHDSVFDWIARTEPDVLCMQETKVVDDDFPTDELLRLGYVVAMTGQKSYNGVAIASRLPMTDVAIGLHDDTGTGESRLIRATVEGVRVYSAYIPNGKTITSPSFTEKLRWLQRLKETLQKEATAETPLAVCGDFNIAPDERDVFDVAAMQGHTHFTPQEHAALADVLSFGLADCYRKHHAEGGQFSWWDYRAGGFQRDIGLRIDFVFATPPLYARCTAAEIDVAPRHADKPSDHAPVVATFE